MESAWNKHLADIQEWGLEKGQEEPDEELLHLIAETHQQVDECLETSRYFYQMKTVAPVRTLTTTSQDDKNGSSQTGGHPGKDDQPMIDPREVFAIMSDGCLEKSRYIREFVISNYRRGAGQDEINEAVHKRNLLRDQLTQMKTICGKLRRCMLAHDIDVDYNMVLADITGMLKQT